MLGLSVGLGIGTGSVISGGGGATTTWNAATSSTDYTLSGGNLTATHTAVANDAVIRASASKASGYFEVAVTMNGGSAISHSIGLANSSSSIANNVFVGSTADSIGWLGNGAVYKNSVQIATWSTYTTGDKVGIVLKGGNFYGKKNGVIQGGADADAGTGGLDVSAVITNGLPMAQCNAQGTVFVLNCGQGAFSGTVPTGITAWG